MRVRSREVLRLAAEFRAVRRRGLAAVLDARRARLERLVAHARARSPFYARLYAHVPHEQFDVRDLPSTSKRLILDHFDEVVTDERARLGHVRRFAEDPGNIGRLYLDEFVVASTSGTTGQRFVSVQSVREWETLFALNALEAFPAPPATGGAASRLLGAGREPFRVAAVVSTSTNQFTLCGFAIVPDAFERMYRLDLVSATLPIVDVVDRLNGFRPERLHGYPTVLEALAHQRLDGRLDIHPLEVSSSSEPLKPRARATIERAFGTWVQNSYGSCEGWVMAKECPHGRMHVCVEGVMVEAVDHAGNPVQAGERSAQVLVTNLHNFTQPILRYAMQDSVIPLDDPCACGSMLPSMVLIGREDDTLIVQASGGQHVAIPPMLLESLMLPLEGYDMFQIRQTERNRIRVLFVPRRGTDAERVRHRIGQELRGYLDRRGLDAVAVDVEESTDLERSPISGKTKQIASEVGPPPNLGGQPAVLR